MKKITTNEISSQQLNELGNNLLSDLSKKKCVNIDNGTATAVNKSGLTVTLLRYKKNYYIEYDERFITVNIKSNN